MRTGAGGSPGDDRELASTIAAAARFGPIDVDRASRQLERTLEALGQIDRNAHLVTVIECWLDELANAGSTQRLAV